MMESLKVAQNGQDALHIWRESHAQIDLLLTDVIMPGVGGVELAQIIKDQCPDLPIIYMSGYAEDMTGDGHLDMLPKVFVQKPFTLDMLAQMVRKLLDGELKS